MNVLVDTSVWSLALRRKAVFDSVYVKELSELIHELRVAMIGPIRQELLSGISEESKYNTLRDTLRSFEDIPIETEHYEMAARLFNHCRKKGIQGSAVDFLICAVGIKNKLPIFTLDKDFEKYKGYMDIMLYKIRKK